MDVGARVLADRYELLSLLAAAAWARCGGPATSGSAGRSR